VAARVIANWRIKTSDGRHRNREAYGVRRALAALRLNKAKRRGLAALHTLTRSRQLDLVSIAYADQQLVFATPRSHSRGADRKSAGEI
jgi:hypothetical protein